MLMRSLLIVGSSGGGGPSEPTLNAIYGTCFTPGDGGGYIECIWSVNDAVGGEYITMSGSVNSGDPTTDTGPYGGVTQYTSSPAQEEVALGLGADGNCEVKLYSASNVLLDSKELGSGAYPI